MSKLCLFAILSLTFFSTIIRADEADDKLKALEKRYESLEQRYRALEEKIATLEKGRPQPAQQPLTNPAATLAIGPSGFMMRSADTNFSLRVRGLLQTDSRSYLDDGGVEDNDTFLLRRARLIFEGTVFRDFDFLLVPDFGGTSSPSIRDAWLQYRYAPPLQLRIGKQKVPLGLERAQGASTLLFMERSLASDLTPARDLGIQLLGDVANGFFNYGLGIFNGVADDRTTTNADFDDEKSAAGRIFIHPFAKTALGALHRFGLGLGASVGNQEGASGLPAGRAYATEGQQDFFEYRSDVIADGQHWRLAPQAYYYYGPFGLLSEYVVSSQKLRSDAGPVTFANIHHDAWHISASWVITGEDASFKGVAPERNFDPTQGSWGAFQVAARYSSLDIDDDVFPLFANPTTSATGATAWTIGVNWFLNRNIRCAFNFTHTDFDGGDAGPITAQDEQAFLARVQLAF